MKMPTTAAAFLIANSVVAFLTAAVVGLRVVSRVLAGSKLGWDDYFTLLALPQAIVVLAIQGICKGFPVVSFCAQRPMLGCAGIKG